MKSRIQSITRIIAKFQNILSDELSQNNNIIQELEQEMK
jgi:hypothetical protein